MYYEVLTSLRRRRRGLELLQRRPHLVLKQVDAPEVHLQLQDPLLPPPLPFHRDPRRRRLQRRRRHPGGEHRAHHLLEQRRQDAASAFRRRRRGGIRAVDVRCGGDRRALREEVRSASSALTGAGAGAGG